MRTMAAALGIVMFAVLAARAANDEMKMPTPQKEHQWLQQFAGEWESDVEMFMEPGAAPQKSKGTESVRAIGPFWIMAENNGTFMNMPFKGVQVLGYDNAKKKYVGTWTDSFSDHLWQYEGSVDASGKILTLESEGPCPKSPTGFAKFRDVTEVKSNDHRVFTSSVEQDGKWVKMLSIDYRRVK